MSEWERVLPSAQAILNFALERSGLIYNDGRSVRWAHLLLRDFLAAKRLMERHRAHSQEVKEMLLQRYFDPLWREVCVLLTLMLGSRGLAEDYLDGLKGSEVRYSESAVRFISDCVFRGLILTSDCRQTFFESFEVLALKGQGMFGSCPALYNGDDWFGSLLQFQRIPEGNEAIVRVVANARADTMVSEWPKSDRSKTFTPSVTYAGPMATLPAIYERIR